MTNTILGCQVLAVALLIVSPIAFAAEPAPTTPTVPPTALVGAVAPASNGPSAKTFKKAQMAGMHVEVQHGRTRFCYEDATVGSHLTTKKCLDEPEFDQLLDRRQAMRDGLGRGGNCVGGTGIGFNSCGGGK